MIPICHSSKTQDSKLETWVFVYQLSQKSKVMRLNINSTIHPYFSKIFHVLDFIC